MAPDSMRTTLRDRAAKVRSNSQAQTEQKCTRLSEDVKAAYTAYTDAAEEQYGEGVDPVHLDWSRIQAAQDAAVKADRAQPQPLSTSKQSAAEPDQSPQEASTNHLSRSDLGESQVIPDSGPRQDAPGHKHAPSPSAKEHAPTPPSPVANALPDAAGKGGANPLATATTPSATLTESESSTASQSAPFAPKATPCTTMNRALKWGLGIASISTALLAVALCVSSVEKPATTT